LTCLPRRAGLHGDQRLAEHLLGVRFDFVDRLRRAARRPWHRRQFLELALAAPAGMDLRSSTTQSGPATLAAASTASSTLPDSRQTTHWPPKALAASTPWPGIRGCSSELLASRSSPVRPEAGQVGCGCQAVRSANQSPMTATRFGCTMLASAGFDRPSQASIRPCTDATDFAIIACSSLVERAPSTTSLDAIRADHHRHADEHVLHAIFALEIGGAGQNAAA